MPNSSNVKYENSLRYRIRLDDGESSATWTDGGYSTVSGIASDTLHVSGAHSVSFDKESTASVNGFVAKEIDSGGADFNDIAIDGVLNVMLYLPASSGIDHLECRLVSDTPLAYTNYVSWSAPTFLTGWNHLQFPLLSGTQTGDGLDWTDVRYLSVGVVMSAAGNKVAGVLLDSSWINVPLLTTTAA